MPTPLKQKRLDPWFALQVRAGRESYVANLLESKGLTVFCPTYSSQVATARGARKKTSALFSGYLFCRINMDNRMPVLGTTWVGSIVGAGRSPIPVPEEEVAALRTLVENATEILPHDFLDVGQKVRVLSGPLTGLEGIVSDLKNPRRVVVSITLLQRSVAAELDSHTVEPLAGSAPEQRFLQRRVA